VLRGLMSSYKLAAETSSSAGTLREQTQFQNFNARALLHLFEINITYTALQRVAICN
jgi:hypothetical protein